MKRIVLAVAGGALLGSVVTLTLVLWIQGGIHNAVAQGEPSGATINGDVNGDGKLNVADGIYIINYVFRGGPYPVSIDCPPTGLPATGQTKCYNGTYDEIPCDDSGFPGQDGFYQAGCQNEGRFIDHGDGTVTDTCTGLMWQKETVRKDVMWNVALRYCDGLSFAGHDDWRLPNVRELHSIVDYGHNPTIAPVFSPSSSGYWSSSVDIGDPHSAWVVDFGVGSIGATFVDEMRFNVRAVRGGL